MDVCLGDSPAGAIAGPVILAPIINQADTVRRVPLTLETMAGSPDRLLGLFVADPEMSGDAVHYHRERVLISKQASLRGTKPARLDAGADLAMVGAAGRTLLNRASAQCGHKRNKAAKTNEISATMQAPLITRSAIFSIAGDRPNVPKAAKSAVSMHAMATRRKKHFHCSLRRQPRRTDRPDYAARADPLAYLLSGYRRSATSCSRRAAAMRRPRWGGGTTNSRARPRLLAKCAVGSSL